MSKGAQVQETPQQKAMAEHAVNLMNDYKQRWLPVQQKLAGQIEAEGAEGSAARKEATGKAATDTQMQFGQAQGALEKGLTNSGAAVGSSKSNLAIGGAGADLAKSKGLSGMIADQQIDDAYTQGLGALMAIGQGKAATVSNSLASQAQQSQFQSTADARASLAERQGTAGLLAQGAGYGLQSAMNPAASPNFVKPNADGSYNNPNPGSNPGMGIGGYGVPTAGGR
jgi:hypothetical protein